MRSEQVTMLPSSGFEVYDKERDEYFFMKHACLNETLSLDGEDSGNDPKFFPQNGDSDEKNLRTLIGVSVVAGISDAVLEQIVYGSLAHFYLKGRDQNNFIHDPECAVAVARRFIKSDFPSSTVVDVDDDNDDGDAVAANTNKKREAADEDNRQDNNCDGESNVDDDNEVGQTFHENVKRSKNINRTDV